MRSRSALPVLAAVVVALLALAVRSASERHGRTRLRLAAGVSGGAYQEFAQALADLAGRERPRLDLEVLLTSGAAENAALLESGQADLAICQSDTSVGSRAEVVAALFPETIHLIVAAGSPVDSFTALRGRRVALPAEGSGTTRLFWVLARHFGLGDDDLTVVEMTPEAGCDAVGRRRVDATFWVVATGSPLLSDKLAGGRLKLLPIDQVPAIQLRYADLEPAAIPRGAYRGEPAIPAEPLASAAVRAVLLADHRTSEATVRQLTTLIYEHRSQLADASPPAALIDFPASAAGLGLPVHAGAAAYYDRDKPGFLVANAEPIGLGITVALLLWSWLAQLRSRWDARQRSAAGDYYQQLVALLDEIPAAADAHSLEALRDRLREIFRSVIGDLEADRLPTEAFRAFSLAWDVAHNALRTQERSLGL